MINARKTFAIISHPDAGKTTLTERLLLESGAINIAGNVKSKKSSKFATSDWMKLEQERGISVTSTAMQFLYRDVVINLLDTPGHQDFTEDTYRTLTAVDSALMVIDSVKGVEDRTIKLLEVCRLRNMPIITFINKLDRIGKDLLELIDEIEQVLKIRCCPINLPIGKGRGYRGVYSLVDDIALIKDEHKGSSESFNLKGLEKEVDKEDYDLLCSEVELIKSLCDSFDVSEYLNGKVTPIFFGSAIKNVGVKELLSGFIELAPAPLFKPTEQREVSPSEASFSGFVFKIQANMDPAHRDRIAFLRICSGSYQPGMMIYQTRTKKKIKLNNAITFMASQRTNLEEAYPGDIIGIHNHGTINIGDSFTEGEDLHFTGIPNFAPEMFRRVVLKDPMKSKALRSGLVQLCEEGATQMLALLHRNEFLLGAVGVLQFDVVKHRLEYEYGVKCELEATSFQVARWLDFKTLEEKALFLDKMQSQVAQDHQEKLVFIATSKVNLNLTQERWPDVEFMSTREIKN